MEKKNTRRGNTQQDYTTLNMGILPPWRGKMSARTKEGVSNTPFLIPPLPAFGHPLPPGARKTARGFTLIELLVVVLIIGILAAVAVPQYQKAVEKARMAEALTTLSAIQKGIDIWILENGFPTTTIDLVGMLQGNENRKQDLEVDVESNLDCTYDGGARCRSKYWSYEAQCRSTRCSIEVSRLDEDDEMENICDLYANKTPTSGWNYHAEIMNEKGSFCLSLAGQGWDINDNR